MVDDAEYDAHFVSILTPGESKVDKVTIKDLDGHGDYSIITSSEYVDDETGLEVYRRSSSMDYLTFAELVMDWLFDDGPTDETVGVDTYTE
tara:strand:- start:442 stop:714 length:273 start_codon:yes stop_codon:yes gene_type:complete